MTIWFTSDSHFHHANIITFCNRPFADVRAMNDALVEGWNSRVQPSDHIYHLGDVTMERDNQGRGLGILERCNGHKRLILGNHDHYAMKHYLKYFEKVMAMNVIGGMRFTHIPVHPASMGRVAANVHGHIHNNQSEEFKPVKRYDGKGGVIPYINISVEVTDYHPVSLEEIKEMVRKEGGEV